MTHRIFAVALAAVLTGLAWAQPPNVDAFVEEVITTAEAIQDSQFLALGRLIDGDGSEIPLELEVQLVPGASVASVYIVQPDALADNIIVLQGDAVYNYTFLTHQITIFDSDDPDALGGLIGVDDAADDLDVDATFDVRHHLAAFEPALVGEEDTPYGPAWVVRFDNADEDAQVASFDAVVPTSTMLPYTFRVRNADGEIWAELAFENLVLDQGLTADEAAYLPEDAERIDLRD
ncbi:MAG: hypothetical protein WD336_10830 [Trueperaceae bacterium]